MIIKMIFCEGFVNIANLLVRNGATVDKEDTYGYTPIYLALKNGEFYLL